MSEQRVRVIRAITAWEGGREGGRKRVKPLIAEMTEA